MSTCHLVAAGGEGSGGKGEEGKCLDKYDVGMQGVRGVHLHNMGLQFPHITRGHAVNPSARAAAAAAAADGAHETQKPNHHMLSAG